MEVGTGSFLKTALEIFSGPLPPKGWGPAKAGSGSGFTVSAGLRNLERLGTYTVTSTNFCWDLESEEPNASSEPPLPGNFQPWESKAGCGIGVRRTPVSRQTQPVSEFEFPVAKAKDASAR